MPQIAFLVCFLLLYPLSAPGQATKPKDVRDLAKGGSDAIPQIRPFLKNPDIEVRIQAVKSIVEIGTQYSLDPLVEATADADAEIQIRATDGLVNFYLPGYLKNGISGKLQRAGTFVRAKLSDTNDDVIDSYVQPRPDVIVALGKLARGGISMESRANAARAVGILRGGAAAPDLFEAMKSKDDTILYESVVAVRKIGDPQHAAGVRYLLRDLNEKIQVATIETVGVLRHKPALADLVDVLDRAANAKVRRAALTSIAMMPDESTRPLLQKYLADRDDGLRGAAAEGFGRLKNPADKALLQKAFQDEGRPSPKLSMAFALVALGATEVSEFSPLQLLINTLNSRARQGEALALLTELAREESLRKLLLPALDSGTKDEKIFLSRVLASSGGAEAVPALEKMSHDTDLDVAREGVRALQNLRARL